MSDCIHKKVCGKCYAEPADCGCYEPKRGKCRDEGDERDFVCSECGMHLFKMYSGDSYTMVEKDMMTIIQKPLFCPWCGREVER